MNGSILDGRFQLLSVIGAGGEARVFRARDAQTGEDVAIRMPLQPHHAPAQSVQIADSPPGWVRFLHWGADPVHGTYQVFDLVTGPTLSQRGKAGPLTPDEWLGFARQSLDAVGDLHATGFVHGDLNAQNFIRADDSPDARWILVELPFLRFNPPEARSTMFGSIHTLSPEQLGGHPPDFRSDLYALGCLYYFAACGAYPHSGTNSSEVAISRLCHEPIPLAEAAPNFPAPWAEWIMSGLLPREPSGRFDSVVTARARLGVA